LKRLTFASERGIFQHIVMSVIVVKLDAVAFLSLIDIRHDSNQENYSLTSGMPRTATSLALIGGLGGG